MSTVDTPTPFAQGGTPSTRLLMVGLDAVSLPFIQEHIKSLPNIEALIAEGGLHHLTSPARYLGGTPWPTFAAASAPGHHGHYFPFQWDHRDQTYREVTDPRCRLDLDFTPFWHELAASGVQTIAFDVPHVRERAVPDTCLEIVNWSYQSTTTAHASDPSVLADIRHRFGHHPIGPEVPITKTARQCARMRDRLVHAATAKADAALYLMERPWQLFIVVFFEGHRAGHNLWPIVEEFASDVDLDAMLTVYKAVDTQIGRVIAGARSHHACDVALFSIHGMAPNQAQDHFLPEIVDRLNRAWLNKPRPQGDAPRTNNLMAYLRKALPPTFQHWVASHVGQRARDWVVNRALTARTDWSQTPAIPILTGGEGAIRLNMKGRERNGILDPENSDVERFTQWLIRQLSDIKVDGTGEPLIAHIHRVGDVFPGPRSDNLPDILLEWAPSRPATSISSPLIGTICTRLETGRGGNHTADAFATVSGRNEAKDRARNLRDVTDLGEWAKAHFRERERQSHHDVGEMV